MEFIFKKCLYGKAGIVFFLLMTAFYKGEAQKKAVQQNQKLTDQVNVFLGSSGDHGQLSPAASYPFSILSIGPLTYPITHTGYEYLAKEVHGFLHNRFEGTGCMGSGGNILIKPFIGNAVKAPLIKHSETAAPGNYSCSFTNGLSASFAVKERSGLHQYTFPEKGPGRGLYINLSHAFNKAFVAEKHTIKNNTISGWIDSKTTCNVGVFRTYYFMELDAAAVWEGQGAEIIVKLKEDVHTVKLAVSFSSVSEAYAKAAPRLWNIPALKKESDAGWAQLLSRVKVSGDTGRKKLFYSLLYRTIQSPYLISEPDGSYRTINGSLQNSGEKKYNGWAIWDNYKTQLPLLALVYPEVYQDVVSSVANLYPYGKKDFSTQSEPSNTVRTEHAVIVLLDAWRKGFKVDFTAITDSLMAENNRLDFSRPDKALESAYDSWALAEILRIQNRKELSGRYFQKALDYKKIWEKEFKDLTRKDVDQMAARGMYQGTIRQYRWSVPFDVAGLMGLAGGKEEFIKQLDEFFDKDYYNRTNEPDLQAPLLYNAAGAPWKAQFLMHKFAVDTVVNHYFNDNSRGIGAEIDRIFKNQPKAFIRTMDDDAGAMSAWFVFAALGLQPACVGWPVYYIHAPLFPSVTIQGAAGRELKITAPDYNNTHAYVKEVFFNGKKLDRNWITHKELSEGGELQLFTSREPVKSWGINNQWIPDMLKTEPENNNLNR